jgi:hypothetical protein
LLRKLSDIAIQDTSIWKQFSYAYATKEIHKKGQEAEILGLLFLGAEKFFWSNKNKEGGISAALFVAMIKVLNE